MEERRTPPQTQNNCSGGVSANEEGAAPPSEPQATIVITASLSFLLFIRTAQVDTVLVHMAGLHHLASVIPNSRQYEDARQITAGNRTWEMLKPFCR